MVRQVLRYIFFVFCLSTVLWAQKLQLAGSVQSVAFDEVHQYRFSHTRPWLGDFTDTTQFGFPCFNAQECYQVRLWHKNLFAQDSTTLTGRIDLGNETGELLFVPDSEYTNTREHITGVDAAAFIAPAAFGIAGGYRHSGSYAQRVTGFFREFQRARSFRPAFASLGRYGITETRGAMAHWRKDENHTATAVVSNYDHWSLVGPQFDPLFERGTRYQLDYQSQVRKNIGTEFTLFSDQKDVYANAKDPSPRNEYSARLTTKAAVEQLDRVDSVFVKLQAQSVWDDPVVGEIDLSGTIDSLQYRASFSLVSDAATFGGMVWVQYPLTKYSLLCGSIEKTFFPAQRRLGYLTTKDSMVLNYTPVEQLVAHISVPFTADWGLLSLALQPSLHYAARYWGWVVDPTATVSFRKHYPGELAYAALQARANMHWRQLQVSVTTSAHTEANVAYTRPWNIECELSYGKAQEDLPGFSLGLMLLPSTKHQIFTPDFTVLQSRALPAQQIVSFEGWVPFAMPFTSEKLRGLFSVRISPLRSSSVRIRAHPYASPMGPLVIVSGVATVHL